MIAGKEVMPKTKSIFCTAMNSISFSLEAYAVAKLLASSGYLRLFFIVLLSLVEVGHHIYALCDNFTTSGAKF